jgi:chitinase
MLMDTWADVEYNYTEVKGNIAYINQILKKQNPALKTLISVGGWGGSEAFSNIASSEISRKVFADSLMNFITIHGFDGVDIDWEYPTSGQKLSDKENFSLLLSVIKKTMISKGLNYILSAAVSANVQDIPNMYEVTALNSVCDFINVMAYDLRGSWNKYTGHASPLFRNPNDPEYSGSIDDVISTYINLGLSLNKINLGIPFYGRGFAGVPSMSSGLFQSFTNVPIGDSGDGTYIYQNIMSKNMSIMWDPLSKSSWAYNSNEQNGLMISFDNSQAVKHKSLFVIEKRIGGIMIWDLSGDMPNGFGDRLIDTIFSTMNPPISSTKLKKNK